MSILIYYKKLLCFSLVTKIGIYCKGKFYYFSKSGLIESGYLEGSYKMVVIKEYNYSRFEDFIVGTKCCKYSILDLVPVLNRFLSCNKFSMLTWLISCLDSCTNKGSKSFISVKNLLRGI